MTQTEAIFMKTSTDEALFLSRWKQQAATRRRDMKYRHALRTLLGTGALLFFVGIASQGEAATVRPPVASDCSEDVTETFNAWLATVKDGSTIQLDHNGCYLSNGTIMFANKRNITIRGYGATIKASGEAPCPYDWTLNAQGYCVIPRNSDGTCPAGITYTEVGGECIGRANRSQLRFELGGDIVVRNLTVQGSNFTPDCAVGPPSRFSCYDSIREGDGNIHVLGSDGVLIDNVHFKNAWGDAFQASPGGTWDADGAGVVLAQNVTVQRSTVDTAGRHALSCTGCRNFVVQDNTITNIGYWEVDIEVETRTWNGDITLKRNTFSNVYVGILVVSPHISPSTLGPIVVQDNVRTAPPRVLHVGHGHPEQQ
jgi:hypothetical protein